MRVGDEFAFWTVTRAVLRAGSVRAVVELEADGTWRWEVVLAGDRLAGAGRPTQGHARTACKRALASLQVPDKPWPRTKRRRETSYCIPARKTPAGHRWVRLDVRGDHLVRGELPETICGKALKVRGRVRRVATIREPGYHGACYHCNLASHDLVAK